MTTSGGSVSWPGVGCVAVGYLFGRQERECKREVDRLRNIPRYTDFAALERDVSELAAGAGDPNAGLLVALSGVARADDADLVRCDRAKDERGNPRRCIYLESTDDHHVARQAPRGGEWLRESQTVSATQREAAAWRLEDARGDRVNMHRASSFDQRSDAAVAGDWHLAVAHDSFEQARRDPVADNGSPGNVLTNIGASVLRRVLYTGPHTTASAW